MIFKGDTVRYPPFAVNFTCMQTQICCLFHKSFRNLSSFFIYPVEMLIRRVQMGRAVCTDDDACCACLIYDLFYIILDLFLGSDAEQVCIIVSEAADHALVME